MVGFGRSVVRNDSGDNGRMRRQGTKTTRRRAALLVAGVAASVLSACSIGTAAPVDDDVPTPTASPSRTMTSQAPVDPPSRRPEPSDDRGPGPDGVSISVP